MMECYLHIGIRENNKFNSGCTTCENIFLRWLHEIRMTKENDKKVFCESQWPGREREQYHFRGYQPFAYLPLSRHFKHNTYQFLYLSSPSLFNSLWNLSTHECKKRGANLKVNLKCQTRKLEVSFCFSARHGYETNSRSLSFQTQSLRSRYGCSYLNTSRQRPLDVYSHSPPMVSSHRVQCLFHFQYSRCYPAGSFRWPHRNKHCRGELRRNYQMQTKKIYVGT